MDWHRLFGLMLTDFFAGSPFIVEMEKDLSLKQQFLDVVIVRKQPGELTVQLPDGFDRLTDHNLISFKSYQEAFDAWAMKELIGHYVNYRKHVSSTEQLVSEACFRLFAVCARFPAQLASQVELREMLAGVYQCRWGTDDVRLIVLRELPCAEHNAPLHLFSAVREQVQYAQGKYRKRSIDTSSLIKQLLARYQQEGIAMPYTMEDFRREVRREFFESLTPDEALQLVARFCSDDFLHQLTPEQRRELETRLNKLKGQASNET